jgi:sugar/nucleoside kinase (ribokinase family)
MSLLVVGSTAYDSIETPDGSREDCLGGSATYFSLAARFFTEVRLVSVVGKDFRGEDRKLLEKCGVDTLGLETKEGETFRWSGRYHADMNHRDTVSVNLNVFEGYQPVVPMGWRRTPFLFLANGHPEVQASVLAQMEERPHFVVVDTMDLWIDIARDSLLSLLKKVDGIVLNDEEARQITYESNLIKAGQALLELGPRIVLIKKGEHGSFLFSHFFQFALPSYPTEDVSDPTGAGDSFAGGFMGFLAGRGRVQLGNLKRAMAFGTVTASINVESFGVDRLAGTEKPEIESRYQDLLQFIQL